MKHIEISLSDKNLDNLKNGGVVLIQGIDYIIWVEKD
jgi:hypothetical protein